MSDPKPFPCSYFMSTPDEIVTLVDRAVEVLADVDFDTLVGTGLSGSLALPMLAHRLGKHFVIVRKDNDDSHHGGGRLVGTLGHRWVFFDDFVASGRTKQRVYSKIEQARVPGPWDRDQSHFDTEYVGDYLYRVDALDADGQVIYLDDEVTAVNGDFISTTDTRNRSI